MALYDLSWYFLAERQGKIPDNLLDPPESDRFEAILAAIFTHIETATIGKFDGERLSVLDKQAILRRFKGVEPAPATALLGPLDVRRRLVRLVTIDRGAGAHVLVDGQPRGGGFERVCHRRFNHRTLSVERISWLPLAPGETISLVIAGQPVSLALGSRAAERWRYEEIVAASVPSGRLRAGRRLLVWLARLMRRRYGDAWLFMDRDNRADDNAEHLYRWTRANDPERRIDFALRRSSRDWRRLKREGFRLLPFGGVRHRLAALNAEWLISSHADETVRSYSHSPRYGNPHPPAFAFLQHGVVKEDVSRWLNAIPLDLLVTTAPREAASILGGPYRLTEREVALTGLARHDRLFEMKRRPEFVTVMPTWRLTLTRPGKNTSDRLDVPEFAQSRYYQLWQAILGDQALADAAREAGFSIAFLPHPNMEQYLRTFKFARGVVSPGEAGMTVQDVVCRTALLVTGYSSIAFDVALLGRPIIYCQFDRELFYRDHTAGDGYFDYAKDGFGEVCAGAPALAALIREYLTTGCAMKPEYAERAKAFLPFRNGENCRRIHGAILARSRFAVPRSGSTR